MPEGPRAGPAPPHQLGGLRERCKLPRLDPGQSPGHRRVLLYSEPSDCLSQHLCTCCIQFAWLGIRFFQGDIHINIPHINSWVSDPLHIPRFRRPWWQQQEQRQRTDHHVGLLNQRQRSAERGGQLGSELGRSEVSGKRLRKSAARHQAVQDPDSVGEQTGIGQSPEPADATVYGPLHVTTDTRRPELMEGQQRQHLTEQTTNNQVLTNVKSVSNFSKYYYYYYSIFKTNVIKVSLNI